MEKSKSATATTLTAQERALKKARVKELTKIIHNLLDTDPRYRDSDRLLINRVQRDEILALGLSFDTMSATDFFRIRLDKKITSEDTITRLRREVQEYYPETRGDKYKKRQSKQTDVQDDLHDIENEIINSKTESTESIETEVCDYCDGSGKINGFECNMCGGTKEVAFK